MIESAPPTAAAKAAPGRAQHVHARLAPAHRPPRGFGMDRKVAVDAGGLQRALEQQAHGAQLGDGEELVGVGGKRHADARRRTVGRQAAASNRRRLFDHGRQHRRQFLRLRRAGRVPDATVGQRQRAGDGTGEPGEFAHRRLWRRAAGRPPPPQWDRRRGAHPPATFMKAAAISGVRGPASMVRTRAIRHHVREPRGKHAGRFHRQRHSATDECCRQRRARRHRRRLRSPHGRAPALAAASAALTR